MAFDMLLYTALGADPMASVVQLWGYERSGQAVPLYIGDKGYGKYRWTVVSHSMRMQSFDARGNVTSAVVSVNLQEYLRS